MAEVLRKAKKQNFTEVEVETLVGEMEAPKVVLFGGHGIKGTYFYVPINRYGP